MPQQFWGDQSIQKISIELVGRLKFIKMFLETISKDPSNWNSCGPNDLLSNVDLIFILGEGQRLWSRLFIFIMIMVMLGYKHYKFNKISNI